jgi:hypothetical protein
MLMERVKKSMEIDAQRGLWSRRIRSIQILSGIVIVYFGELTCANGVYMCMVNEAVQSTRNQGKPLIQK